MDNEVNNINKEAIETEIITLKIVHLRTSLYCYIS